MDEQPKQRIPIRIFLAMVVAVLTLPLPLALSKGNFFHEFTVYDRHLFTFFFAYIGGIAGAVFLAGSTRLNIKDPCLALHRKKLAWRAYYFIGVCFLSMHILRLLFRGVFDYLESLL